MEYNELINDARKRIPEFDAEYRRQREEDILDADSGVHVVFAYAVVPRAVKAAESDDKNLQKEVFGFIEDMAKEKDKAVSEVCDFTVMEGLRDEVSEDILKPLLGRESLLSLSAVSGYMNAGG